MGTSGHPGRTRSSASYVLSALVAMVCTLAMLAGALTVVRPAQAAQDGNLRIEIDNPAVGNWNVSQEGQSVNIAVGQKVSFSLWNLNGSGVGVAANTALWYVNDNPIALCKSVGDSGNCQQNNEREDDFGAAVGVPFDANAKSVNFIGLREGTAQIKAVASDGSTTETATTTITVHPAKLKIVRTKDSRELTDADTTELTAGEDVSLQYYVTFDGDGENTQNKCYSYQFTSSQWNNPPYWDEEVTGADGKTQTVRHSADGWGISNGAVMDFNGQTGTQGTSVKVRTLVPGTSAVSLNTFFAYRHKVASTNADGKTTYKTVSDLYGNISASTNFDVLPPTISVQYGDANSPVTVDNGGQVDLSVGEMLQFSYGISPLHPDYADQHPAHWDSSNKQVATIDSDSGKKLTAIDTGSTSVTVSIGGETFDLGVAVAEPTLTLSYQGGLPEPVDVTDGTMELTAGEQADLTLGFAERHDYASLNSMKWKSSDTSIVTVNGSSASSRYGSSPKTTVTAKKPGDVTVTGTLAGRNVTATVHVVEATLDLTRKSGLSTRTGDDDSKVYVTNQSLDVTPGESVVITSEISPVHGYAKFLGSATSTKWTEDSRGKTISMRTGSTQTTVTAVSAQGADSTPAVLTATAGGKSVTLTFNVVKPQVAITQANGKETADVTGQTLNVQRNTRLSLGSSVTPLHPDYATFDKNAVKWASSAPTIATVQSETNGTVTGRAEGEATITAVLDGVGATANVNVTVPITAVENPADVTTGAGTAPNLPVSVKATWENGKQTEEKVTWNAVPESSYARPGSFTVTGKVEGYNGVVRVKVVVNASTQEMYRLYNPNSGEHFYTAASNERDSLKSHGWKYEGVGWIAPIKSASPVYRLYNPNSGDHHYTMDSGERNGLLSQGWRDEGIGWYSAEGDKRIPLYRQYNPNARTGSHNYTLNTGERDTLVKQGWHDEGISWYAVSQ